MFYYVSGTVAETEANLAVIDCGGVGYACATTNYTLSQLKKGVQAKLYTYLNVREDAMELFGFASRSELRCFKLLISVSGVGPKDTQRLWMKRVNSRRCSPQIQLMRFFCLVGLPSQDRVT